MPDVEYMHFAAGIWSTPATSVFSQRRRKKLWSMPEPIDQWARHDGDPQGDGTQDRGSDKTCVCLGVRPNINILYILLASSAQLCISHMESPEDTPVRQPMQRIFRYSNSFDKALVAEMAKRVRVDNCLDTKQSSCSSNQLVTADYIGSFLKAGAWHIGS